MRIAAPETSGVPCCDTGRVDSETGGEVVAGIDTRSTCPSSAASCSGATPRLQCSNGDVGVERRQRIPGGIDLGASQIAVPVQDLALQVGQFHCVVIGDRDVSDSGGWPGTGRPVSPGRRRQ